MSAEIARRSSTKKEIPSLNEFLQQRDYTGALTLLEFKKNNDTGASEASDNRAWIAYCAFHLADYKKAAKIYENLIKEDKSTKEYSTYIACCYFYLGMYPEANKLLSEAPDSPLKKRLALHLALKLGNKV